MRRRRPELPFSHPSTRARKLTLTTRTGCWASSGYNTAGCLQVELALRACMDAPPPQQPKASEINYHLGRFQNRVAGKRKQ